MVAQTFYEKKKKKKVRFVFSFRIPGILPAVKLGSCEIMLHVIHGWKIDR